MQTPCDPFTPHLPVVAVPVLVTLVAPVELSAAEEAPEIEPVPAKAAPRATRKAAKGRPVPKPQPAPVEPQDDRLAAALAALDAAQGTK